MVVFINDVNFEVTSFIKFIFNSYLERTDNGTRM